MSGIDDAFYEGLVRCFSRWQELAIGDPGLREECRMLLEREARPRAGDPRRAVAVAFDDRRRLQDRAFRLRTGYAWSQAPASRPVHLVSNVEVFENLMVRSNFVLSELRAGETRLWAGW